MMKTQLVVLVSILIVVVACGQAAAAAGKTYYVSTSGDDSADGLAEKTAWRTIAHAAKTAKAGDTVKIKAGKYVGENVVVANSGTKAGPIVFEGYGGTPVLEGKDQYKGGYGIYIKSKKYIKFKNIKLTRYYIGVYPVKSDHITLDGIIAVGLGRYGIQLNGSEYCTVRNCSVTDAGMCNILLYANANHNLIEDCTSLGIRVEDAVDYYIGIAYGHDNIIRNCTSKNKHQWSKKHPGHGIGIKDNYHNGKYAWAHSYNNKIINCETHGHGEHLFVAHCVYNNEFIDCTAYNDKLIPYHQWNDGIRIRDGAHHNTFRNCRAIGVRRGITFGDTVEGPPGTQYSDYNTITNCVFEDLINQGVSFKEARNNVVKNCVIAGAPGLFYNRNEKGNKLSNCVICDVKSFGSSGPAITYSNFWKNGFKTPSGAGNISKNPLFVNTGKGDFRLKPGSPCRSAGEHGIDMGVLEPWTRPIWVVHAGGDWDGPENTIAALKKSVALGARYAEIDLRVTKDGQIVVIHDGTLDRTTNGKGRVKELAYAQIKRYDAGSWFRPEFKGERVPLLSDVLDFARAYHMRLLLHVKEPEVCPLLFDLLKKYGMIDDARVYMMAANAAVRKALDPRIKQYSGSLIQPWGYKKGPKIVLDALKNKKKGGALMRSYTCVLEAQKMENDLEIAE
ncbi:MAG: right-handed parallel beta-helix repeat-containing protein [Phycisphaerae bacterium]|nr:right-handed parallel beta-helix repeat-containing protein [Phycisphaerae bacterium]